MCSGCRRRRSITNPIGRSIQNLVLLPRTFCVDVKTCVKTQTTEHTVVPLQVAYYPNRFASYGRSTVGHHAAVYTTHPNLVAFARARSARAKWRLRDHPNLVAFARAKWRLRDHPNLVAFARARSAAVMRCIARANCAVSDSAQSSMMGAITFCIDARKSRVTNCIVSQSGREPVTVCLVILIHQLHRFPIRPRACEEETRRS